MITLMVPVYGEVDIPDWVTDHRSFRRWVRSGVLPEKLPVHYINGRVWVDFVMEEFFTHNQVKAALGETLRVLVRREKFGVFVPDGMLLTHRKAGVSTEPDAMIVSHRALKTRKVRFAAGKKRGARATELVGTPDVVIEVVSPSSEDKAAEWLMTAYHNAGVSEYWLIDARAAAIRFVIHRRKPKGYDAVGPVDGWVPSAVLGRSFRLSREEGAGGVPDYSLDVR